MKLRAQDEAPQKLRGGFYTPPDIAAFITKWVLEKRPGSLLEPSCGDGVFLRSVLERRHGTLRRIFACELEPAEAAKARSLRPHGEGLNIEIRTGDFLQWFLFHGLLAGPFDAVVGNPPFVRYQYLSEEQQCLSEKIFARYGLPFTKHTNAWVPFVIASVALLAPGGRLGLVLPAELFHITHARALRRFLGAQCSGILVLDPEELWFDEAMQGIVLLLAEKKESRSDPGNGVAVQVLRSRAALDTAASDMFANATFVRGEFLEGKWMSLFLTETERSLLQELRADPRFAAFADVAQVDVGIVTGANQFFLVPDEVVKACDLGAWAHPMFGRSEHVAGLIYDPADHQANRRAGLPANFLWFGTTKPEEFPEGAQQYLRMGEAQGLPRRFKCRVREPWYAVPSVYAAPVAMLKRAHQYPRLVLNKANAFSTDTAYRVQVTQGTAVSLVYSFLTSLTCLCAELEGRHYGGGVLELVPSEIERLLLPRCAASEDDLRQLDIRFRNCTDAAAILNEQDQTVLGGNGLGKAEQDLLHRAWDRLRRRRQRGKAEPRDEDA